MALLFVLEGLKHKEVANGCFERVESQRLFEQVLWWGEVCEKGAPGSKFCFAGALHNNIEILARWECGLEKGNDGGEEGPFPDNRIVRFTCLAFYIHFFVKNMMKQNLQAMGKIGEVREVPAKGKCGRGAEVGQAILKEVWEE